MSSSAIILLCWLQVSPRGASGLQLQVPGPGLVRAQGGSPDKLLILMSPGKEAAGGGGVPRPQQVIMAPDWTIKHNTDV